MESGWLAMADHLLHKVCILNEQQNERRGWLVGHTISPGSSDDSPSCSVVISTGLLNGPSPISVAAATWQE